MDRLSNCNETFVGFASPKPNFLKIKRGMRLILATRSRKPLSKEEFPIAQGIMKLFGSLYFGGNFFCKIALHSSVSATIYSSSFLLFEKISFMN